MTAEVAMRELVAAQVKFIEEHKALPKRFIVPLHVALGLVGWEAEELEIKLGKTSVTVAIDALACDEIEVE